MPSIDHFDLRSFDLNLLVAFDALMDERSVTRAAARLKVGQPAMSHSLQTLRLLLDDELLVRVGATMRPTVRAEALAPRIRDALGRLQETLRRTSAFDPAHEERTVRVGFSSELELITLPDLAAHLATRAPGIRLIGRRATRDEVYALLDDGGLDLAIGCYDPGVARHRGLALFEQRMACCHNPALLDLPRPVDVATYVAARHALVTLQDDLHGCLADALERLGVTLNVVMAASDFLPVLAAAAQTPLVATLPMRMARRYGPRFGLEVEAVPLDLRVPAVAMVWSARFDRDAARNGYARRSTRCWQDIQAYSARYNVIHSSSVKCSLTKVLRQSWNTAGCGTGLSASHPRSRSETCSRRHTEPARSAKPTLAA